WYAALTPLLPPSGIDPVSTRNRLRIEMAPNPFDPALTIQYELDERAPVTLRVFDAQGRARVTLLEMAALQAGPHRSIWDGRDDAGATVASGIYFVQVHVGQRVETTGIVFAR
ncbi:FlgD immunoglobulin-like domain containing protein, partial [Candidatus Eisenbacteria bacterium]